MIRAITFALLAAVLITSTADARRRAIYRIERTKPKPPIEASTLVRIIPIVRWKLWCERIGGLECPER